MDLLLAHPPALSGHFQSEDVFHPGLHTHLEDLRRWRQIKLVLTAMVGGHVERERKCLIRC